MEIFMSDLDQEKACEILDALGYMEKVTTLGTQGAMKWYDSQFGPLAIIWDNEEEDEERKKS